MSKLNFKIVAIEPRVVSFSCPLGTSGRVHASRLRRRFQSTLAPRPGGSNIVHDFPKGNPSKHNDGRVSQWEVGRTSLPKSPQEEKTPGSLEKVKGTSGDGEGLPGAGNGRSRAPWTRRVPDGSLKQPNERMKRRIVGDMYNSPVIQDAFDIDPRHPADTQLNKALHGGKKNVILEALIRLMRVKDGNFEGHRVLAKMSPASFSEVLRILDPVSFVGRFVELHRHISVKNAAYFNIQPAEKTGQHQFITEFMLRINSIIEARRRIGNALSLSDYKYLLRCARAVGDQSATRSLWNSMQQAGVGPDIDCYNHYLGTIILSDTLNATRRHALRVLPKHMEMRQSIDPPLSFTGHRVGPTDGIKRQTTTTFHQMVESGLVGDEETFCLLMLAMAREGDLDGLKSVLSKVWGLDVNRIMMSGEGDVKFFAADSPLRPSKTLLFSVAHAFSINNDIPVALQLIDYISREYGLDIPTVVWEELLDQTYMLCTPRTKKAEAAQENGTGKLPPEMVSKLWVAMLGEPYNVKPTMNMYDKAIVDALRCERFGEAQQLMQEAGKLRVKEFEEYQGTRSLVRRYRSLPDLEIDSPSYQTLKDLERDESYLHFRLHRSGVYRRRWCRLFIQLGSKSLSRNPTFTAVNLPQFVKKYMAAMPRYIEYRIATGVVRFPSQYRQHIQRGLKATQEREMKMAANESMPVFSDEMVDVDELNPLSNGEILDDFESPIEEEMSEELGRSTKSPERTPKEDAITHP